MYCVSEAGNLLLLPFLFEGVTFYHLSRSKYHYIESSIFCCDEKTQQFLVTILLQKITHAVCCLPLRWPFCVCVCVCSSITSVYCTSIIIERMKRSIVGANSLPIPSNRGPPVMWRKSKQRGERPLFCRDSKPSTILQGPRPRGESPCCSGDNEHRTTWHQTRGGVRVLPQMTNHLPPGTNPEGGVRDLPLMSSHLPPGSIPEEGVESFLLWAAIYHFAPYQRKGWESFLVYVGKRNKAKHRTAK